MRRDLELVRQILLALEAKESWTGVWSEDFHVADYEHDAIHKNLVVMAEAELIAFEAQRSSTNSDRIIKILVFDLTWKGHEYLDTIRDPEIWKRTKGSAKKLGGVGFDMIVEIAKGVARSVLRDAGIPIA